MYTNGKPKKPFYKRLKPAGWLALAIVGIAVVGSLGLLVRPLIDVATGPHLRDDVPPPPTITRRPDPTPRPSLTPTPEGWAVKRDELGQEYLAPPPQDERAIREAFEAVLACLFISDRPDAEALQYDREAAIEKAAEVATAEVMAGTRFQPKQKGVNNPFVSLVKDNQLGPENPVRCEDYVTCTIARAKLGTSGAVVWTDNGPVVGRPPNYTEQGSYMLYTAIVQRREDGAWKIVELQKNPLSMPSP